MADFEAEQVLDQLLAAFDAVYRYRHQRRPARLVILVEGKGTTPMTAVSDIAFTASVVAEDAAGRVATDTNQFVWTVDPSTAATVAPDPADPSSTARVQVSVTAPDASGNQASFVLDVSDGTLTGVSDQLVPEPGAATHLHVNVA